MQDDVVAIFIEPHRVVLEIPEEHHKGMNMLVRPG